MNISQNVEKAAKFFPDSTAIIFEGTPVTYRNLNTRIDRLANALKANGIGRGECVALYLPNIPEFVIGYLATVRVGAIAVSINSMYKSGELSYILNDSTCVLVFTTGELLPNIPFNECPSLKQAVICEGDPHGRPTLDEWLAKSSSDRATADMNPDDPAVLLYTSSPTAGRPCIMRGIKRKIA